MSMSRYLMKCILAVALALVPMASHAGVFVSVNFAPPELPVYEQPECPGDGYLWTPGYWGYGEYGYYWVPGVWIQPPGLGLLWTPGYWGYGDGGYFFHGGYWGSQVGFYGGIDYGYGYGGNGFYGGQWRGGHYFYNTAVNRVNVRNIRNVYVNKTVINNNGARTSFNGGRGGINARPTEEQKRFDSEHHTQPTSTQLAQRDAASKDRGQFAKFNGGKPGTLAADKADSYQKAARDRAKTQPLTAQDKTADRGGPKKSGGNKDGTAGGRDQLPKENAETKTKPVSQEKTTRERTAGPKKSEHHNTVSHEEKSRPRPQQHAQQHASHSQSHAGGGPKPQGGGGDHKGGGGGDHKDKH